MAMAKCSGSRPAWASASRMTRDLAGEVLGRRRAGADPAVAEARGAPKRGLAAGAEPDRRPGPLDRPRLQPRAREAQELAVERDLVAAPQRAHDLDALDEPAHRAVGREAEGRDVLVRRRAEADADREPPARQAVERRDLLREQDRLAAVHHDDRDAEPDVARHGGRVREHLQAVEQRRPRGRAADGAVERPQPAEPERLGAARRRCPPAAGRGRRSSAAGRPRSGARPWAPEPNGAGPDALTTRSRPPRRSTMASNARPLTSSALECRGCLDASKRDHPRPASAPCSPCCSSASSSSSSTCPSSTSRCPRCRTACTSGRPACNGSSTATRSPTPASCSSAAASPT